MLYSDKIIQICRNHDLCIECELYHMCGELNKRQKLLNILIIIEDLIFSEEEKDNA